MGGKGRALVEGQFPAKILQIRTGVDFKVYKTYAVKAKFRMPGKRYILNMNRWAKTTEEKAGFMHFGI